MRWCAVLCKYYLQLISVIQQHNSPVVLAYLWYHILWLGVVWVISKNSGHLLLAYLSLFFLELFVGSALVEKIVAVLPRMKCPYRIEPHQIQGMDFIHIYPVIQVGGIIYNPCMTSYLPRYTRSPVGHRSTRTWFVIYVWQIIIIYPVIQVVTVLTNQSKGQCCACVTNYWSNQVIYKSLIV